MEVWKTIQGFEGLYEVSNYGRVRSLKRATTKGKILKTQVNSHNGYVYACLSKNNHIEMKRVHRLVMDAFKPSLEKLQINHKDCDKTNNRLENLEWCDASQNMCHAVEHGLVTYHVKPVIDLTTGKIYESLKDAATSMRGNPSSIHKACTGERSNYRNHRFAFYSDFQSGTIPEFKGKWRRKSTEKLWVR